MFIETVSLLSKQKNIRIKVDNQIDKLIQKSNEAIHFTIEALSRYEKEANAFCGKAYEYHFIYSATSQQFRRDSFNCPNSDFYGAILHSSIRSPTTQLKSCTCPLSTTLTISSTFKQRS